MTKSDLKKDVNPSFENDIEDKKSTTDKKESLEDKLKIVEDKL